MSYNPFANACPLVGPGHQKNRTELRHLQVGDLIVIADYEPLSVLEIEPLTPSGNGRFGRHVVAGVPGLKVHRFVFDGPGSNFRLIAGERP